MVFAAFPIPMFAPAEIDSTPLDPFKLDTWFVMDSDMTEPVVTASPPATLNDGPDITMALLPLDNVLFVPAPVFCDSVISLPATRTKGPVMLAVVPVVEPPAAVVIDT
jgi:hypothetical protein